VDHTTQGGGAGGRFFGYPDSALAGAWTVADLCRFLRVSERKARGLMRADGAPAPLRLRSDRCDRWNPYQVVAWLHGAELPDGAAGGQAAPAASPAAFPGAPGRPWSPPPADRPGRGRGAR
jgi:hypothetical protein